MRATSLLNLSDGTILEGDHELIKSAASVIEQSSTINYSHKFLITSEIEQKLKLSEDEYFTYFMHPKEVRKVELDFVIDSLDNAGAVTLVALQGDKHADIRLSSDNEWHASLRIPYEKNATSKYHLTVSWDPEGDNNLLLLPIQKGVNYNGSYPALVRILISNTPININDNQIAQQNNIDNSLLNNTSYFPNPTWYDINDNLVTYKFANNRYIPNSKPYKLVLDPTPYDTKMDMIVVDDTGNVVSVTNSIEIRKNVKTKLSFKPEVVDEYVEDSSIRRFIILMNNSGTEQIADLMALVKKGKPFPTTFTNVIEF
ncbi:hypothetical protein DFQ01_11090 [Paenibacillus cellulosilyticus]|uniref:Uncharacterized protein n=2 Tax=Paenibacillus cellulosilyticus TaxID=375489 RepID=A0A2V2YV11_9BACL|nr:hypothetical protein DFQ01_11090 [Paenibacillus cellulosilyticus]